MIQKGDLYYPAEDFQKKACLNDKRIYEKAAKDPIKFWESLAKGLKWQKKWKKAFEHNPPYFKWFLEGKINITENIFGKKNRDEVALIWEPEPKEEGSRVFTYRELFSEVCRAANYLKKLGVKKGDRVGIYLPMIPEVAISMLACARIGAVHSVVFSAFSAQALRVRLQDTGAEVLITADGYFRRGQFIDLLKNAKEGIQETKVKEMIVVQRKDGENPWDKESEKCEAEIMDSEDPFFILYTSGSTGKPKGVLHTCGGYAVQAFWTGKWIFDFKKGNIFWCTSDVGWVTGHTYTFYSPLLNGVTTLIFEGAPDWPEPNRWAEIIEKHKVTTFYTAPTAIRMFEKYGKDLIKDFKFDSLRVLGSVGEPIDESAWQWYFENVGKKRCPIVDTWWQTETGGILISSLPGIGPFKPSFAGVPFPGIKTEIKDGNLVLLPPFAPGMLRGIYNNPEKYQETYWSQYGSSVYFTSDAATVDENGLIRIIGRVDDVIKVAGHRISTGELEAAINLHPEISESAVVGIPDEIKGEAPIFFVSYKGSRQTEDLKREIVEQIKKEVGPIALPKEVYLAEDLPKTRSGKIMRRILRKLFTGEELGDLSTLSNPESVEKLREIIKPSS
ncbi:MAG: acetate--CoA ligase [Candidatus Nealsonbacteria bacterium]|nr:acetate--CoA ligase [Candidatus Nealsonbacteria bacterium]